MNEKLNFNVFFSEMGFFSKVVLIVQIFKKNVRIVRISSENVRIFVRMCSKKFWSPCILVYGRYIIKTLSKQH